MSSVTQSTTLEDLGISGSPIDYKGEIDCSANPNYPAAGVGDTYIISVAGKIGGASGLDVEQLDLIICKTAGIAGTQAAVGANWSLMDSADPLTLQILGTLINSATAKATPIDADIVGLVDSAAGNIIKGLSWLNIKATLKTYFDTLYAAVGSFITASSTDTLTNKTIDANGTGNNISNLDVANLAAGVLDTDISSVSASHDTIPSALAVKTYADGLVAGLLDDRGNFDASVNLFPATGGSGTAGAILKGDIWYISVAGTLGGISVEIGDSVRAIVDTPGQTAGNWSVLNTNLTYVAENAANKVTSVSGASTDTQYPSAKLLYDQLLTKLGLGGGTMTGNITLGENTSIALDPAGSADGKYTGITVTGVAGYTQAFGDLVYLAAADSRWEAADADAATTADRMLAMVVVAGTDGAACTLLLQGIIRADAKFPALTIGSAVYVGETAGEIQVAIPTGADNVIRRVGYALTAEEIYFNPSVDSQISVA